MPTNPRGRGVLFYKTLSHYRGRVESVIGGKAPPCGGGCKGGASNLPNEGRHAYCKFASRLSRRWFGKSNQITLSRELNFAWEISGMGGALQLWTKDWKAVGGYRWRSHDINHLADCAHVAACVRNICVAVRMPYIPYSPQPQ